MKPWDRDIKFGLQALFAAFIIVMLMQGADAYMHRNDPPDTRFQDTLATIQMIQPDELPAIIDDRKGKPLFLFVYASWCPYCRQIMPSIVRLAESNDMKGIEVMFLSWDRKKTDFAGYLIKREYTGRFTPYMIKRGGTLPIAESLALQGASFENKIPYFAVFDNRGKLAYESLGLQDRDALVEALDTVRPAN